MNTASLLAGVFVFALGCQGLELSLDRNVTTMTGGLGSCGVLLCKEKVNAADDVNASLRNIYSLVLFRKSGTSPQHKANIRLAFVSTKTPHVTKLSNGVFIQGALGDGQASLRVEMSSQKDCDANYECQVSGLDGKGQKLSRSTQIPEQVDSKGGQAKKEAPGIAMQVLNMIQQLDKKVTKIEKTVIDKIDTLEQNLEQRIRSGKKELKNDVASLNTTFDYKMSVLETSIAAKVAALDGGLDKRAVSLKTDLERTALNLKDSIVNRTDALEHAVDTRLESLEDALVSKVQNGIGDTLSRLESKLSAIGRGVVGIDLVNAGIEDLKTEIKSSAEETRLSMENHFADMNATIGSAVKSELVRPVCEKEAPVTAAEDPFPYPVMLPGKKSGLTVPILCDMETDKGGWILIQRRATGKVSFYRDWLAYKEGFGWMESEFWLGNEKIHSITKHGNYELRVDLKYTGRSYFARYDSFSLDSESNNYKLRVGKYTDGTAGNSLTYHNGQPFTTKDKDNDRMSNFNCADSLGGGWWYKSCHDSNLNGNWMTKKNGANWYSLTRNYPVTFTEMKIRRKDNV